MKQILKRVSALVVTFCMLMSCVGAMAQAQDGADLEALYPLMDLVCAAALDAQSDDEYTTVIPDGEGELSPKFIDSFIRLGQTRGETLGITPAMMTDTMAQMGLLTTIFAAQMPTLSTVVAADSEAKYIGFRPGTVNNTGENQSIQVVGEIYTADKAIKDMTDDEFAGIQWLDRGIFTFQSDASALNGFRLTGFSSGTDLNMEEVFMSYTADTVTEYTSAQGFTISFPAVFDDAMLKEDANGVSAELPDKTASFFARRTDNTDKSVLDSYVKKLADGIQGATYVVNEQNNYGTVTYTGTDGYVYFDIYIVTETSIYQAELKYQKSLGSQYSMYISYIENSFVVDEVAAG